MLTLLGDAPMHLINLIKSLAAVVEVAVAAIVVAVVVAV